MGKSLANSVNKKELVDIIKSKLIHATFGSDFKNPPQDHLKLLDHYIQSDIVKKLTLPKKKHYLSSKVAKAIELNEGVIKDEDEQQ